MSHALLLRLFLSPSFFTVHVALQYLKLYSDNIGITYYLTRRLRELDTQELRDVWGFICHLLITRPSKSRALECFVVDIAQRSTHIAMITLWFMQAALQDLAPTQHQTQSFVICQRVLHKCHEIIFGDLPPPATLPYAFLDLPFQARFTRKKVRANAEPALVGIGMVLAGAPAMPQLTQIMGEVAIEQGRVHAAGHEPPRAANDEDDATGPGMITPNTQLSDEDDAADLDEDSQDDTPTSATRPKLPQILTATDAGAPQPQGISLTRRKTIGAAKTSPALPLHMRTPRKPRLSDDPLGQNDPQPLPSNAASSSPSISSTPKHMSMSGADFLLQKYDLQAQSHLLRSYFCRSEVQFLITLESISNRLLVVPRPARVSALRAELTALNHKLPAEVCMPMWCSSSDTHRQHHTTTQPHHRIVRIPPGESVVLNSAQHAPYLLLMEILNDDLDFDPANRANKEALDRIVKKENERKGGSRDLLTFNATTASHRRTAAPGHNGRESTEDGTLGTPIVLSPASPNSQTSLPDEEEVDLVEQIYGTGHSLREPIDLSESIMLPPAPKNKELDMAAWSRPSSMPPSPALTSGPSFPGTPIYNSSPLAPNGTGLPTTPNTDISRSAILSLDEYSERMRTAAVMLAQLNANLVRESITPLPLNQSAPPTPQPSSTLSWIPGSSWLGSSSDQASAGGPLHPSLAGSGGPSTTTSSRMRVQHSEAAAIRDRIMAEMLALEEERMERMRENREGEGMMRIGDVSGGMKSEDEGIIRRELNRADPSAAVFSESWASKKSRIRNASPYGHLANWDCISVIVKTGGDLRQEQLAVQLIHEFEQIWQEEKCGCWVRYFRILITGGTSGLIETITDAVSIHSIKKTEYARRLAEGRLGHVSLFDHFKATYGDPSSAKFARAQRNFARSLAGYSVVTFLLQIKDRHNGNILVDREGHLIHIDFGFMLSNSPGNIGFEAAPFKLPPEYIEVLGGVDAEPFKQFKALFREGFEAARKHCDRLITLVELMQKDSALPCFAAFGDQTANQLRDRFQPALTHSLIGDYVNSLIDSSLGSNWTRLYDSYQYYSQSIL
ncbi:hypothetical protein FIBSPDRAFT_799570 [Athelia psychrophila]|uniref:1-phosphatidylinositol 4-kinase n=1 Tax=Athelia psychrophila TaxID=1759441 RepID=A0A166AU91_9AGAM|nr:hypothetical protein FIBSPDRAFT_799570 [Fibularhizoctonia sp. CBS 109695]